MYDFIMVDVGGWGWRERQQHQKKQKKKESSAFLCVFAVGPFLDHRIDMCMRMMVKLPGEDECLYCGSTSPLSVT